jgi:probable F420-dependent oxidoreductase
MHLGTIFSQADSGTDAAAIRTWASTAEQAGFHHVMAYDHVLGAPVERVGIDACAPFPSPPYTDQSVFHEVFTLFAHLAALTERIEFVTSVLVLPQRSAALVAKQIATVDRLSGGRLNVAVGIGWNAAEYEGLGADFATRTPRLEEQIDVVRRLLTEPLVTYHGRFHTLDRVGINPLPERTIPIWMGSGGAERVLRRVARTADGWMPLLAPGLDRFELGERVTRLRQICEEEGRDPDTMPIWGRCYLDGTDSWRAKAEQAVELGFSHFSVGFDRFADPSASHERHLATVIETLPALRAAIG